MSCFGNIFATCKSRELSLNKLSSVNILLQILSHMNFDDISNIRLVNKEINKICSVYLTESYFITRNEIYERFRTLKVLISKRKLNSKDSRMIREFDIIESIYIELNVFDHIIGKYIADGRICFFPGLILDEIRSIQLYLSTNEEKLGVSYNVTKRYRELVKASVDHFQLILEPRILKPLIFVVTEQIINSFQKLGQISKHLVSFVIKNMCSKFKNQSKKMKKCHFESLKSQNTNLNTLHKTIMKLMKLQDQNEIPFMSTCSQDESFFKEFHRKFNCLTSDQKVQCRLEIENILKDITKNS